MEAAWQVGGVILNGPPEGGSILYNDGEEFGRSLQVISSPAAPGGDVGWYQWTHPQTTEVVDIAGISAELIRPAGEWTVVRFVSGERIIEVRGHQLNDDEVLASAATLREATDAEWGVG